MWKGRFDTLTDGRFPWTDGLLTCLHLRVDTHLCKLREAPAARFCGIDVPALLLYLKIHDGYYLKIWRGEHQQKNIIVNNAIVETITIHVSRRTSS